MLDVNSPLKVLAAGILMFAAGFLLYWYREDIGKLTGVTLGLWGSVTSRTPGWMLVPFALALMLAGAALIVGSLCELLFSGA